MIDVNIFDSIISAYKGIFDYGGKATRYEWWSFYVYSFALMVMLVELYEFIVAHGNFMAGSFFTFLVTTLIILPFLAITQRRLNDRRKNKWYIFVILIPLIGPLSLLIECSKPSLVEQ